MGKAATANNLVEYHRDIIRKHRYSHADHARQIQIHVGRLEGVAESHIMIEWGKEFPDLKAHFLSCCSAGCLGDGDWNPSYFLYRINDSYGEIKKHKKFKAIEKFCKRMTKELGFDVWPHVDAQREIKN